MTTMTGGCACGRVRFEAAVDGDDYQPLVDRWNDAGAAPPG